MVTLGNVYHDFPRLAKQSGFYFQLHTGRVNWSEIENLNIDEIIEKRNFQLLEDNLINIINCNLEREYDLKILDPNFVKLFRLAQLGVDYLSFCEMYLDRCVVLLQEQLTAFQEECESLKQENQKKRDELNKSKRKNKIPSYQCEKCEKVFISDMYLKFHVKRRHSVPSTPDRGETMQKKCMDNWQQTEVNAKLSISTQTTYFDDASTITQECVHKDSIKLEHSIKIENLEQELKNLKERLKKAESSLLEKAESHHPNQSDVFQLLNVPGSMYYNPLLMLLPPYLKQSGNYNPYEIKPGCSSSVPSVPVSEVPKPHCSEAPIVNSVLAERKTESHSFPQLNTKLEKENEFPQDFITRSVENFQITIKEVLECEKENLHQNISRNTIANVTKPLPPPRKLKRQNQTQFSPLNPTKIEELEVVKDKSEEIIEEFEASGSKAYTSTPIKENESKNIETSKENLSLNQGTNLTESLESNKSVMVDDETKSFVKKIVAKSSPRLWRFSNSLKTSVTNLYSSFSSAEKEPLKKGWKEQNIKETIISGINNRLRELGVDPEWRGIPKKTMKQKLNVLKYKRKLSSKENPMFPVFRQNLEEKIYQKLKNNFGKKKALIIDKLSKQQPMTLEELSIEEVTDKPDFVKVKKYAMYDMDSVSESGSDTSDLKNLDRFSLEKVVGQEFKSFSKTEENVEGKETEFDFSVFQVARRSLNSLEEQNDTQQKPFQKKELLFSDSESEDGFLGPSDEKLFKTLNGYKSDETQEKNNEIEKYGNMESQSEFSFLEKQVNENQTPLQDEIFVSRLSANKKKKVLFANYSAEMEEDLSDSPVDDDLWPFKSDSEKDVA